MYGWVLLVNFSTIRAFLFLLLPRRARSRLLDNIAKPFTQTMAATAFLEHQSKQNNRRKLLRSLMFACEKSLGNLRATKNQKSSERSVGKNKRSSPIAPTKSYQNYTRLDDAFKESSDLLILLTYIISTEYLFSKFFARKHNTNFILTSVWPFIIPAMMPRNVFDTS